MILHVIFETLTDSNVVYSVPFVYLHDFTWLTCVCSLCWVQEADFRGQNSCVLAFCGMIGNGWNMAMVEWSLIFLGSKAEAERDIGAVSRLSRRKSGRQERAHCLQAQRTGGDKDEPIQDEPIQDERRERYSPWSDAGRPAEASQYE